MSTDADKLLAFIEDAGLSYKENSRSYVFDCPRCHRADKLYMEKRTGRFICFFCAETEGYKGRPEYALSDLAARPLREVRKALYGESAPGATLSLDLKVKDFFGDDDTVVEALAEIPTMRWPVDYYPIDHEHAYKGRDYLLGRGIGLSVAMEYGLRYCPVKRRVIFPVELGDRLVGWQERIITNPKHWDEEGEKYIIAAKMLSSKDIPTSHVVMFANRMKGLKHVVVCEGPIDAMKAHLCGGNIATMGKAIGKGQIDVIRNPELILSQQMIGTMRNSGIERVYLALDGDAARETSRLVREFSDMECFVMQPPRNKHDLGEMDYQEVYDLFKNARRVGPGAMFLTLGRR